MISALLHHRSLLYYYRLVKPNISEFKSIEDLQYDQKQRQITLIQQLNARTLAENKSYTRERFINETLNISQDVGKEVAKKHLNFTAISPKSLKSYTLEQAFDNGKIQYPFSLQEVQSNLPELNSIPMHYSYKRGLPILTEYQLDKKIAYVFNLPQNLNTRDISEKLGLQTVKQIKIQYCRLGLPAYAKVYFNSDQAVTKLVLKQKSYIQIQNRLCFVKTYFDKQKLELHNRRLVIRNIQQNQEDLIFQLSQYGRVVHLDYPTFITRNVSLEEVREKYRNSDSLVKINHHRRDGSVESEYYPSIEESYRMNTTTVEYQANVIEKKQRLNAMYKNRMRYAHQIDVWQGKQNQVSIKNMGFCIVTYSCTEQAQNCYFNTRMDHKVQLYDYKNTEEFQIDQNYRKKILRLVDSQYRKTKNALQASKTLYQKDMEQYFDQLGLFERLIDIQTEEKALSQKLDDFNDEQPQVLLSYFRTRVNQIKRGLGKKLASQSFDELAEKQLYGRVLPKHDSKKAKLQMDVLPEINADLLDVLDGERLQPINTQNVTLRDKYYNRLKIRQAKIKSMNDRDILAEGEGEQTAATDQAQAVEGDEEFTGTRGFSTIKKRSVAFRSRNPLEQANYILRYCEFVRSVISEYQGVFPQNRLKANFSSPPTFLNPEKLCFADGNQYITEDDLPKILECMRNPSQSQSIYTEYWKDAQYFKSKNIDINQYRHNIQNNFYEAIQKYTDIGVVKQVYEVEQGQDIDEKVHYLNTNVATFGQEFRVHQDGQQKVIVKIAKVQNICPLDKLTKLTQAKSRRQTQFTQKQKKTYRKYKNQMLQSGQIPQQIRKEFNIPQQKTLDDLFEELSAQAGIYKKDIETLLNTHNFTSEQLSQDIGLQIEIEKSRLRQKESNVNDYAKDPSNIQIKDRDGFFKVSKFRQI